MGAAGEGGLVRRWLATLLMSGAEPRTVPSMEKVMLPLENGDWRSGGWGEVCGELECSLNGRGLGEWAVIMPAGAARDCPSFSRTTESVCGVVVAAVAQQRDRVRPSPLRSIAVGLERVMPPTSNVSLEGGGGRGCQSRKPRFCVSPSSRK